MYDPTGLFDIQQLDRRLDEIEASIATHREKMAKAVAELRDEDELLGKKQALEKKILVRKAGCESELATINERQRLLEVRLKSPGLPPASYEATQKELASLAPKVSELETKILEDMGKLETLAEDLPRRVKVLAGRRVQVNDWKTRHEDEIRVLGVRREELTTERRQLAARAVVESLDLYEALRRRYGGLVLFDIDRASCPGCGMAIPKSDLTRLAGKREQVGPCTNCGRLLRWRGDDSSLP